MQGERIWIGGYVYILGYTHWTPLQVFIHLYMRHLPVDCGAPGVPAVVLAAVLAPPADTLAPPADTSAPPADTPAPPAGGALVHDGVAVELCVVVVGGGVSSAAGASSGMGGAAVACTDVLVGGDIGDNGCDPGCACVCDARGGYVSMAPVLSVAVRL